MATKKIKSINSISYSDMVKQAVRLMMAKGNNGKFAHLVPCVFGKAGIGKSQMANDIAKEISKVLNKPCEVIHYVGSLTKDGDIGGLPIAKFDEELGIETTQYAIYYKNEIILRNEKEGKATILFLDEINRAEKIVMDEFMELILHRELHRFKLPEHCFIFAAANPEDEEDEDYQVNVMNPALMDRMFIYNMETNLLEWINWAINNGISKHVINFLTIHSDMLYAPLTPGDRSHPTPRGWEMFSRVFKLIFKEFKNNKREFHTMLFAAAEAKLGSTAATMFTNFVKNNENPIINVKDIFDKKIKLEEAKKIIREESSPRQYFIFMQMIKFLRDKFYKNDKANWKTEYRDIFVDILYSDEPVLSKDRLVGIVKSLSNDYKELKDELCENQLYLDNYFKIHGLINESAELIGMGDSNEDN